MANDRRARAIIPTWPRRSNSTSRRVSPRSSRRTDRGLVELVRHALEIGGASASDGSIQLYIPLSVSRRHGGKERRMRLGLQSVGLGVAVAVAAAVLAVGASAAPDGAPQLSVRGSDYGNVLFGPGGRVVYLFAPDHRSKSTCYGTCAKFWHPLLTNGAPHGGAARRSQA